MVMRLVRRNARTVPWITEEALVPIGRQSSIDRTIGPRMSKSSSSSEDLDSRILRGYCGAKGSGHPSPFRITSPRAQPRRKKHPRMTKEDPQLLGEIAEERRVLDNWCPEKK